MTPQAALAELLDRLGSVNGAAVYVNAAELSQWPAEAVVALKSEKLLTQSRPAASVICPGCERACVMPVHTANGARIGLVSFIVCDKRSDINRVSISAEQLTQWRCDAKAICRFAASSLGLRRSEQRPTDAVLWNIGMVRGNKRSQMLCLKADRDLALVVGGNTMPMAEAVVFRAGKYAIDPVLIRELVDSATTVDSRYTPREARREARKLDTQAMYDSWRKAYRNLKKQRPYISDVWYAGQIAKTTVGRGKGAETIRKHMKR